MKKRPTEKPPTTPPDAEADKLSRLLSIGETAKINLYRTLLNKIVGGEVLSVGELKTYNTLHAELKATTDASAIPAEEPFPSLNSVIKYLRLRDWRIGRSTLYEHAEQGRLRPQGSGLYLKKDVDKYAALYLRRKDGSTAFDNEKDGLGLMEDLQRQKLTASLRREIAMAENWEQRNRDIEEDVATQVDQRLSEQAILLKNDLKNFAYSKAQTIIELVEGNHDKTVDLIAWMLSEYEIHLARYARRTD
jgi:hypothetical protein